MTPPEDTKRGLVPWLRNRVNESTARTVERMDAEPEVALQSAQTTLSWSLRHHGPDAPLTVNAKREVAELLERAGQFEEALELRGEVAASLRLQLGEDDPRTLEAEEFQGFSLERLGRHAEALPHFEHVLTIRTDVLGPDDMATLLAMDRLGCVQRSLGNLDESRRLLQEAVDRYESHGAAETEESIRTVSHLATTLFQLEQVSEAYELRKHIFEVRNRILGPDDPATLSSLESLVAMLRWMDESAESGESTEADESLGHYQALLDGSRGQDEAGSGGVGTSRAETSGEADEVPVPSGMNRRAGPLKDELVDLLTGRPGWHLEPSLTPGVPAIWCFRAGGKIEFSVTVEGASLQLFIRDTNAEVLFDYADELAAWLTTNRPAALLDPSSATTVRSRIRKFGEWS